MRRSLTIASPLAVGALVFALAAAYPPSAVHGSAATGPEVPRSIANVRVGPDYRARWTPGDRAVLLGVRDGGACRPVLRRVASTGPARLEVLVDRPTGGSCTTERRWWTFRLTPPPIRLRHQKVSVYIDGDWTTVRAS